MPRALTGPASLIWSTLSKPLSKPTVAGRDEQLAPESVAQHLPGEASVPMQVHRTAAGGSPASKETKTRHAPQTAAPTPPPSPPSLLPYRSLQWQTGQR